ASDRQNDRNAAILFTAQSPSPPIDNYSTRSLRSTGSTSVAKHSSERSALRGSSPGSCIDRHSSVIGVVARICCSRAVTTSGGPMTLLRLSDAGSGRKEDVAKPAAESHFPYIVI